MPATSVSFEIDQLKITLSRMETFVQFPPILYIQSEVDPGSASRHFVRIARVVGTSSKPSREDEDLTESNIQRERSMGCKRYTLTRRGISLRIRAW